MTACETFLLPYAISLPCRDDRVRRMRFERPAGGDRWLVAVDPDPAAKYLDRDEPGVEPIHLPTPELAFVIQETVWPPMVEVRNTSVLGWETEARAIVGEVRGVAAGEDVPGADIRPDRDSAQQAVNFLVWLHGSVFEAADDLIREYEGSKRP